MLIVIDVFTFRIGDGSLNAATVLQFKFAILIKWHRSFERSSN